MEEPQFTREIWQPDRHEQLAACEILLASTIPQELRALVREMELRLATRTRLPNEN